MLNQTDRAYYWNRLEPIRLNKVVRPIMPIKLLEVNTKRSLTFAGDSPSSILTSSTSKVRVAFFGITPAIPSSP